MEVARMSTFSVTITFTFPEANPELVRAVLATLPDHFGPGNLERIAVSTPSTEEPRTDPGFVAHLRDAGDRTRRFWSILGRRAGSSVPIDDISADLGGLTFKQTPGVLSSISRSLKGRGLDRFMWTWERTSRSLKIEAEVGALVLQAL